jgi:hypothetical protein
MQSENKWPAATIRGEATLWTWLGVALAIFYFLSHEHELLAHTPPDWWSWWDQSQYLAAAKAFRDGDWAAAHHWYPPGYSLLAVPFVILFPKDPFVVVDLLCFVGSLLAVARLAAIMELGTGLGVAAFLFTAAAAPRALEQYVLPWTGTPTGCLILVALCLCLSPPRPLHSCFLGLILGIIILIKPVDDVALVPAGLYYLARILRSPEEAFSWRRCGRNVLAGGLAFGCTAAVALLLHWEIYGWHLSAYETQETGGPVFVLTGLGAKLYGLFVNPQALYGNFHQPSALLHHFPWLLPGFCGMVVASCRRLKLAMLSASVLGYVLLYSAYPALTPNTLWYYNAVHYFIWTLPVFGLFGLYLLKEIFLARSLPAAGATVIISILVLALHSHRAPLGQAEAHVEGPNLSLDLSACIAPCVVEVDLSGPPIDDNTTWNMRFDQHFRDTVGQKTVSIQPRDGGLRLLLLSAAGLGRAEITIPGDQPIGVQEARLYHVVWKFF